MATFPTTPAVGDEFTVGNNTFTYNGIGWIILPTSASNITYSASPPAFSSVYEGHIWVNSVTMEQFLYIIDDTPNPVWVSLGAVSAIPAEDRNGFYNNILMNGDMRINQRVQGTYLNTNSHSFGVDRWVSYNTIANRYNIGQNLNSITPPKGFTNYLGFQVVNAYNPAAADVFEFYLPLEGTDISFLNFGTVNASPIVLSFYVYASITGTYSFNISNASPRSTIYVGTYTVTTPNTWQRIVISIPPATTGTWLTGKAASAYNNAMYVQFDLGSGSGSNTNTLNTWQSTTTYFKRSPGSVSFVSNANAVFYVTGLKLEVGTVATDFISLPFDEELRRCKKYFQKSYDYNTALNTDIGDGRIWGFASSSFFYNTVKNEVEMAYAPSITFISSVNAFGTFRDVNGTKAISVTSNGAKQFGVAGLGNAASNSFYFFNYWASADLL